MRPLRNLLDRPAFRNLQQLLREGARLYPLTWPGSILFLISLYLIGEAYNGDNEYAFLFSAGSFLLLLILASLGRIQAFRFTRLNLVWDTSRPPVAGDEDWFQTLHTGEARARYFFRIHFMIRGEFRTGKRAAFSLRTEAAISGGGEVRLPVRFPVSGRLEATGSLVVRDVFGLTRAALSTSEKRSLVVRPPVRDETTQKRKTTLQSDDSVRRQKTSEEEKYYMRDYQPGDRMKDINWKASFRVMDLITRVSPVSREESKLLHVEFRHYREGDRDSLESVIHLEFLKRWLLSFLHSVQKSHPEYRFRVITAEGPRMLDQSADFQELAVHLGGLGYLPPSRAFQDEQFAGSERFVFMTGFESLRPDPGGAKLHLMRTVRGKGGKVFPVSYFFSPELRPGFWFLRRDSAPVSLSGSGATGTGIVEEKIRLSLY